MKFKAFVGLGSPNSGKMKLKFFTICLTAIAFAACEKENDTQDDSIILANGTSTEQTIYADETNNEDIKFTATTSWTATVEDATTSRAGSSNVDWLTLSQYSGEAGEYTLTLTLQENLTGSSRTAKIIIRSGETVITIIVEQKGTKEDGTVVKKIKQITYEEKCNARLYCDASESIDYENCTRTFSYDEQGRVARIETKYPKHSQNWEKTSEILTADYHIVGEITIKELTYYPDGSGDDEYVVRLNEQGYAKSVEYYDDYYKKYVECTRYKYTPENYLAQEDRLEEDCKNDFYYEDGYWTKLEYTDEYDHQDSQTFVLDPAKCYPNRYPNNGQIDIMGYIGWDDSDETSTLFHLGRLGHMGKYLPEIIPYEAGYDISASPIYPYTTPSEIIHKTYKYVVYPEDPECPLSYKFDKDNYLTEITLTEAFTAMQVDYDIVVGNKLMDPERPEMGYKYEIQNRSEKKIKDDQNTMTWEITY